MSNHHEAGKGSKPRPLTDREEFERRFESIFGNKDKPKPVDTDWNEARMDIIGQNGPTGEHYEGDK